jgi:hypothetical protein
LEFIQNSFPFLNHFELFNTPAKYFGGFSILEAFVALSAGFSIYLYLATKHWSANNYLAISFSVYTIEKWTQTKFWEVIVIFLGLIIYDVSFVFGTDVMMTVAHGFEMPMKILFPTPNKGFSMIGIGDIIVPGLLVSVCLRHDFIQGLLLKSDLNKSKFSSKQSSLQTKNEVINQLNSSPPSDYLITTSCNQIKHTQQQPSRFYFYMSIAGYCVGLLVTMSAMMLT